MDGSDLLLLLRNSLTFYFYNINYTLVWITILYSWIDNGAPWLLTWYNMEPEQNIVRLSNFGQNWVPQLLKISSENIYGFVPRSISDFKNQLWLPIIVFYSISEVSKQMMIRGDDEAFFY